MVWARYQSSAGTDELARLLRRSFGAIPSVRSTRTTIVLGTLEETGRLPIGTAAIGAAAIGAAPIGAAPIGTAEAGRG